ncbi:MAG: hypothetical protein J6J23_05410 [Clostridia bacterium]|nr:hypothetical protein [Clostridia bacterium]
MDRIYYCMGRIVEKTQKMEENLELVVKYSEIVREYERNPQMTLKDFKIADESAEYLRGKMETMTLGQRIHIIIETRVFTRSEVDELKHALEKRNYFVHDYFKLTPFEELSKSELEDEFLALKKFYDSISVLNKKIEVFKTSYSKQCDSLYKKFGV